MILVLFVGRRAELKEYLGNDAEIQVEYVDEIPLLSSGKRKKILNALLVKAGKKEKVGRKPG